MKTLYFLLPLFFLFACDSSDDEARGKFESIATVEMHSSALSTENKHFVRNQLATLQTNHILEATAKELDMEPEALKKSLEISQIRMSDFIKITAHHDDEILPKLIVTTLLENYSRVRKDQETKSTKDTVTILNQEIAKQETELQNSKRDLASRIQSYGIPYFDSSTSQETEEKFGKNANERLAHFQKQGAEIKKQIRQLDSLEEEDLILYAAGLDLPQNQVAVYFVQYKESSADRQRLLDRGLGQTHPDVVALDEKMRTSLEKAKMECLSLLAVLKTKQELIDRQIEKRGHLLEDDGERTESLSLRQQNYKRAKERYEDSRLILKHLKIRKEQARAFLRRPEVFFTIHEWEHK
ncbi:hypothetical protein N9Y81_00525 [Akkermansiaceae bacterium]|nr:hypothetical protein [Akkermansiaceae bacterium]